MGLYGTLDAPFSATASTPKLPVTAIQHRDIVEPNGLKLSVIELVPVRDSVGKLDQFGVMAK
jgi:hypothetical protein